jgi:hypothetical protein
VSALAFVACAALGCEGTHVCLTNIDSCAPPRDDLEGAEPENLAMAGWGGAGTVRRTHRGVARCTAPGVTVAEYAFDDGGEWGLARNAGVRREEGVKRARAWAA